MFFLSSSYLPPSCGECRCGGVGSGWVFLIQAASFSDFKEYMQRPIDKQLVNESMQSFAVAKSRHIARCSQSPNLVDRFKSHKKLFGHRQNIIIFALPQHRQVWPFRVWMAQLNESMTEKPHKIFGKSRNH